MIVIVKEMQARIVTSAIAKETENMKRREFIVLTSAGAASATLLGACGHPENKLIPVFIPDEEYVPGLD